MSVITSGLQKMAEGFRPSCEKVSVQMYISVYRIVAVRDGLCDELNEKFR